MFSLLLPAKDLSFISVSFLDAVVQHYQKVGQL